MIIFAWTSIWTIFLMIFKIGTLSSQFRHIQTWHGQSACSFSKWVTQADLQLLSLSHSSIHSPSVLLFVDTCIKIVIVSSILKLLSCQNKLGWNCSEKLTLHEEHIGFLQPEQPSTQSVWHGQAEYSGFIESIFIKYF